MAVGFALYIPQYTATQPIRILQGVLVMLGCFALAWGITAAETRPVRPASKRLAEPPRGSTGYHPMTEWFPALFWSGPVGVGVFLMGVGVFFWGLSRIVQAAKK